MDNNQQDKQVSGYSLIATDTSQAIAKKQNEMARLRQLETKKQTAIKAIIGGGVLAHAVKDDNFAKALITALEKSITADSDLSRVNDTINNLRKKVGIAPVVFTPKEKPKKDSDKATPNATQATDNKPATTTPPHTPPQPQGNPQR